MQSSMVSFKKRCLLAFISLLLTPLAAAVYTPSEVPSPKKQGQEYYVADPDSLLADSTVQWLNSCAAMLDEKTHVEMAVVALSAIEETSDAFDFSYELFQRWGIGREGQNTGVLILFVLESHDVRIMTGTGIEGVLTDAVCSRIIQDEMVPAFRAGDYDEGLCLGALAIYEICTDGEAPEELLAVRSFTNRGQYAWENEEIEWSTGEIIVLWIMGLGVVLIIIACWFAAVKKCPKCGKRKARAIQYKTITKATYSHSGEKEITYRCKHCGHVFTRREIIPKLEHSSSSSSSSGGGYSSSSSSSSGSWGGGSTSGGGAGGKW